MAVISSSNTKPDLVMNNLEDKKIGFLLIGGIHHIYHLIPSATYLSAQEGLDVNIYVRTDQEAQYCQDLLDRLGDTHTQITTLKSQRVLHKISPKLAVLLSHISVWKSLDALVVAERTSTILRRFMRSMPLFIHIPHGAGDRGKSYDKRIKHFDHVIVAGPKDKRRMIELGLTDDENCSVSGYIKPFTLEVLAKAKAKTDRKIFHNDNKIILYNPHFSEKLSSFPTCGLEMLKAFTRLTDYNFIFAPHIRLFKGAKPDLRAQYEAFSTFDNIWVDLGSENSTNMTYTLGADIYLGDVSSQVYEFLSRPKPCIFLNPHNVSWEGDPDYAHWALGPVCTTPEAVIAEIKISDHRHATYVEVQKNLCRQAKGEVNWNPIERAGEIIQHLVYNNRS